MLWVWQTTRISGNTYRVQNTTLTILKHDKTLQHPPFQYYIDNSIEDDVTVQHSGPVFWSVIVPVHELIPTLTLTTDLQKMLDDVDWFSFGETEVVIEFGTREHSLNDPRRCIKSWVNAGSTSLGYQAVQFSLLAEI